MNDHMRVRHLLMELNQLFVEADLESRKRTEKAQEILQELMAATLPEDRRGQASKGSAA